LFFGYSNKGHDGYLGDSVVAEWCNFGAGSSNSNLKNNYSSVKMWHIAGKKFEDTGRMFLGLVMGDFSRVAINSRINTGTVIGVSSNIFTHDFPPKFINSFNWGGEKRQFNYDLEKAMKTAGVIRGRRGIPSGKDFRSIFRAVWKLTRETE
jgi:hypothetical protein